MLSSAGANDSSRLADAGGRTAPSFWGGRQGEEALQREPAVTFAAPCASLDAAGPASDCPRGPLPASDGTGMDHPAGGAAPHTGRGAAAAPTSAGGSAGAESLPYAAVSNPRLAPPRILPPLRPPYTPEDVALIEQFNRLPPAAQKVARLFSTVRIYKRLQAARGPAAAAAGAAVRRRIAAGDTSLIARIRTMLEHKAAARATASGGGGSDRTGSAAPTGGAGAAQPPAPPVDESAAAATQLASAKRRRFTYVAACISIEESAPGLRVGMCWAPFACRGEGLRHVDRCQVKARCGLKWRPWRSCPPQPGPLSSGRPACGPCPAGATNVHAPDGSQRHEHTVLVEECLSPRGWRARPPALVQAGAPPARAHTEILD